MIPGFRSEHSIAGRHEVQKMMQLDKTSPQGQSEVILNAPASLGNTVSEEVSTVFQQHKKTGVAQQNTEQNISDM